MEAHPDNDYEIAEALEGAIPSEVEIRATRR
jgi:hypothetical protein